MRGLDGFSGAGQMEKAAGTAAAQYQPPSVLDDLRERKQILSGQLAIVDEAIAALETNPEIVKILDLISKLGRF